MADVASFITGIGYSA